VFHRKPHRDFLDSKFDRFFVVFHGEVKHLVGDVIGMLPPTAQERTALRLVDQAAVVLFFVGIGQTW
jgi:hypothetical protein